MKKNDVVKLSAAVVLLAAAAGIYRLNSGGDEDVPPAEETKTQWYCPDCQASFELSGVEMEQAVQMRQAETPGETSDLPGRPSARGRGEKRMVKVAICPKCGQPSGVAAHKCGECGEVFPASTKSGKPAICPKCQWDPMTGKKAQGERAELTPDS